jgi:hypothetical protein
VDPHKHKGKEKQAPDPVLEKFMQSDPLVATVRGKNFEEGGDTTMQINEKELAEIDIDKLEDALNKLDLQTIPVQ